jgi:hypothetical protein
MTVTSAPRVVNACAMPQPMTPPPMTRTSLTSWFAASSRRAQSWSTAAGRTVDEAIVDEAAKAPLLPGRYGRWPTSVRRPHRRSPNPRQVVHFAFDNGHRRRITNDDGDVGLDTRCTGAATGLDNRASGGGWYDARTAAAITRSLTPARLSASDRAESTARSMPVDSIKASKTSSPSPALASAPVHPA